MRTQATEVGSQIVTIKLRCFAKAKTRLQSIDYDLLCIYLLNSRGYADKSIWREGTSNEQTPLPVRRHKRAGTEIKKLLPYRWVQGSSLFKSCNTQKMHMTARNCYKMITRNLFSVCCLFTSVQYVTSLLVLKWFLGYYLVKARFELVKVDFRFANRY